ncbi:helix-turn-helix domain-containing protein [Georgenia wangjunii]|uniref:helix-turn-helix domain-containing protein n=1 Tax=Georgenia wangjunii TaxID=3117730 RepID=UPI002F268830
MPRLLRVPEWAEYVGFSERTVRSLIEQRKVAVVHVGRSVYLRPEEADRLIAEGTSASRRPATNRRRAGR